MEKFASFESPPQTYLYSFTTSGELIALLIKSNNLENENHPTGDQIIELSKINKKIFRLFDFIFDYAENNRSSYLFSYYKNYFQYIQENNYLNKIVTYLINLCETNDITSVKQLLNNLLIADFLPYNKNERRIFIEIWNKTIDSIDNETQNIILYRQKLLIERQFLLNTTKKTKEVEKEQFENRSEYDKIVLEGFCNRCEQSNLVKWSIHFYKKLLIDNIDENNNIFFDCQKCKSENTCIISSFQQTFL